MLIQRLAEFASVNIIELKHEIVVNTPKVFDRYSPLYDAWINLLLVECWIYIYKQ